MTAIGRCASSINTGSEIGLRFALRLSPGQDCGADGKRCDAALSQLVHAFLGGPPGVEIVDALAPWDLSWPDAVLERLVDLLGQELDDSLRASVESAIESAIADSTHHRARAASILAQRCQPPNVCASVLGRASAARLVQQALGEAERGQLASLVGLDRALLRDGSPLGELRGGPCADLTRELREYGRYVDGVPFDIELGDTEMELCDASPQDDHRMSILFVGCARVSMQWRENRTMQEALRALTEDAKP